MLSLASLHLYNIVAERFTTAHALTVLRSPLFDFWEIVCARSIRPVQPGLGRTA